MGSMPPIKESTSSFSNQGLLRLSQVTENRSEYYFKDLIIEPRQSCILKTYSNPFKYENMAMKHKVEPRKSGKVKVSSSVKSVTKS